MFELIKSRGDWGLIVEQWELLFFCFMSQRLFVYLLAVNGVFMEMLAPEILCVLLNKLNAKKTELSIVLM